MSHTLGDYGDRDSFGFGYGCPTVSSDIEGQRNIHSNHPGNAFEVVVYVVTGVPVYTMFVNFLIANYRKKIITVVLGVEKAYVDFKALFRFHQSQAFWICRPKENMKFMTVEQMEIPDAKSGIIEDARIRVTGYKSSKLYPDDMRLVRVYDPDNDTIVDFISNNFEVSALEISNLYRHRWDIEVFFKWIKQNIVVKTLGEFSENAVKIHLWTAVIAYLTVARIKADYKSCYSITEVATLIRISALERVELQQILTKQDLSTNSNQNAKELSLFDDF